MSIALGGCVTRGTGYGPGGDESGSGMPDPTDGGNPSGGSSPDPDTTTDPTGATSSSGGTTTGPASECGNGVLELDESCDDANLDDHDGCDADCTPTEVVGLAVGWRHTCAVFDAGGLRCWGMDYRGQLGRGAGVCEGCYDDACCTGDTETPRALPLVDVGMHVVQAVVGGGYTCALSDAGQVRCWGSGAYGQLGSGNTLGCTYCEDHPRCCLGDEELPRTIDVVDVGGPVDELGGGSDHVCARLGTAVRCWGRGQRGRLGYGNDERIGDDEHPSSAGDVSIGAGVVQIASGDAHNCVVIDADRVQCWGLGQAGRLGHADPDASGSCNFCYEQDNTCCVGDDEHPSELDPVDVGGPVAQVVVGGGHSCALLRNNEVRCWGTNGSGQLGYPGRSMVGITDSPAVVGPVDVGGGAPVVQLAAGFGHTCALLQGGEVRCWGRNGRGQLGLGHDQTIGDDEAPASAASVDLGGPAMLIGAGDFHTCAVLESGGVRCWGEGSFGQLGQGNVDDIGDDETPAQVPVIELW